MFRKPKFLFIALLLATAQAWGAFAFGLGADGHLDKKALRKAYEESDFDKVTAALEAYRKAHPATVTLEEKIFTYKYLGVIYAADSNTSIKAESNFNQLLDLSPHIELVDMYISPKIQALFDRIKAEHEKRKAYSTQYDELGMPLKGPSKAAAAGSADGANAANARKDDKESGTKVKDANHNWIWWTAGGAAIGVGVGVGVYLYLNSAHPKPDSTRGI